MGHICLDASFPQVERSRSTSRKLSIRPDFGGHSDSERVALHRQSSEPSSIRAAHLDPPCHRSPPLSYRSLTCSSHLLIGNSPRTNLEPYSRNILALKGEISSKPLYTETGMPRLSKDRVVRRILSIRSTFKGPKVWTTTDNFRSSLFIQMIQGVVVGDSKFAIGKHVFFVEDGYLLT